MVDLFLLAFLARLDSTSGTLMRVGSRHPERARKVLQYFVSHLLRRSTWARVPFDRLPCFIRTDWSRCRPEPFDSTLVLQDALHWLDWLGVACAHATCSPMHSCRLSRHLSDHTMMKVCRFTGSHECSVSPSDIEHRDFICSSSLLATALCTAEPRHSLFLYSVVLCLLRGIIRC